MYKNGPLIGMRKWTIINKLLLLTNSLLYNNAAHRSWDNTWYITAFHFSRLMSFMLHSINSINYMHLCFISNRKTRKRNVSLHVQVQNRQVLITAHKHDKTILHQWFFYKSWISSKNFFIRFILIQYFVCH